VKHFCPFFNPLQVVPQNRCGEEPQQSVFEHEGASRWRRKALLSKAAGGPVSIKLPSDAMERFSEFGEHAQAPEVCEGPAKKRYRALKKIPVPLFCRDCSLFLYTPSSRCILSIPVGQYLLQELLLLGVPCWIFDIPGIMALALSHPQCAFTLCFAAWSY
jgi:hypothetical protein